MIRMKYVITGDGDPVVFPETIGHDDIKVAGIFGSGEFVSAGFVEFHENGEAICYGGSTSLKLKSGDNDSAILTRYFKRGV